MQGTKAILFDCDGVLVDTERDGHRVAFNRAFEQAGVEAEWSPERYGELLSVAGGKERMAAHFDARGWPVSESERDAFIRSLHEIKTQQFRAIVEAGALPARPGIARIVDEAHRAGLVLAVCSTSSAHSVEAVIRSSLGTSRRRKFSVVFAGDIVPFKKPDPAIYRLASRELGLRPPECLVIEDSRNGLLAATAAGMPCVVTTSRYTRDEEFPEACAVYADLGDPPGPHLTLPDLIEAVRNRENAGP